MKLWIYEIHIFELQNEEINVKKILAVINATYAVAKRKPEKIRLAGIRTLTSAIPVQHSNQLSYQANWELVIKLVRNIPGKNEDEVMNIWNSYIWTAELSNKCKDPRSYFFRLSFRNCISCVNNCEDLLTFISSFRSSNIWISYIHNFIFIFPGYITNQFNDQLPVGLIAQLARALHRYRRDLGSNPGKPDCFRLSFRNCISCVNNCEDLLYI